MCEHGGGGKTISLLLSDQVSKEEEKIYFDDVSVSEQDTQQMGWYMGKPIYSNMPIRREISIKKALNYGLSRNCNWEKWRASLAIGYASNKMVYCFPWMNTLEIYDCLYNSAIFQFFRR